MEMTRRTFLTSAASVPIGATLTRGAFGAPEAKKKFRACIIGDTKQGGYGHSLHRCWALRDDVEVVALADPDEAGRRAHAEQAKAQRTYADYRKMLEKEKPDLVTVGPRWTMHHQEYLLAAAAIGAHGFMEKPLAADLAEADAMIRAIEEKKLKWSIAFNFRALPIIEHARRLIFEQGLIGDVLEARGRGKEDHRAGGEDLLVLGTHIFDLMRYFLGNPLWCEADITVDGRPAVKADVHEATEPIGPVAGDRIQATYAFQNGVKGYFASTRNAEKGGGRWGLDIYGSKGVVTIRQDVRPGLPGVFLLRDPSWAPGGKNVAWEPLPDAPTTEFKNPDVERNAPIINDLLSAIQEDRKPKVSLQDGRDSLEMIQAGYEAHVQGGRVAFPLKERGHPLTRWR